MSGEDVEDAGKGSCFYEDGVGAVAEGNVDVWHGKIVDCWLLIVD